MLYSHRTASALSGRDPAPGFGRMLLCCCLDVCRMARLPALPSSWALVWLLHGHLCQRHPGVERAVMEP